MQRRQILVQLSNKDTGQQFIDFLEKNDFENVHNITYDTLKIKVLVIENKKFFSTNTTCLAALAGCGIRPLCADEYYNEF